jgi:chloride channel protein, CIC family
MRYHLSHILSLVRERIDERLLLIMAGAFTGVCGGFASFLLNLGLEAIPELLHPLRGHWYGMLVPAAGAAGAVVCVRYVFRDQGGHGVPEIIYSISRRGGFIRLRLAFSRLAGCLLTIASGGSAGPEAPIATSGASIGSTIAGFFRLRDRQRIVMVGCGSAGAIASIFNAPVAGLVFTLEVILGEWSAAAIVPIAIASVAGTVTSRALQGNQIPFELQTFDLHAVDIISTLGLALCTALVAVFLTRMLRAVSREAPSVVRRLWLRAALGGLGVGVIGLYFPEVYGEGYKTVRLIIANELPAGMLIVFLLIWAKIIATVLTVGSGGTGGIFAPALVIGSCMGLFYHQVLSACLPDEMLAQGGYFALLGMAGVLSSVLQAPLTGIFLIVEISGSYELLVSVVLVAVLSSSISKMLEPASVYHHDLIQHRDLLRPRTDARILSELSAMEILEKDCCVISPRMLLRDIIAAIQRSHRNYFAVEDPESGLFMGLIHLDDIRPYLFDTRLHATILAEELMDSGIQRIAPDDDLAYIMNVFDRTGSWSLPVVHNGRFAGMVSKATILDHYRNELLVQEER